VGQRYDFGTEGGLHDIWSDEEGKCICIKVERIILLIVKSKYIVITEFKTLICCFCDIYCTFPFGDNRFFFSKNVYDNRTSQTKNFLMLSWYASYNWNNNYERAIYLKTLCSIHPKPLPSSRNLNSVFFKLGFSDPWGSVKRW